MNVSFPKRTVLALLLPLTVIGCSATERLNRAASAQGQASARVTLPALPDDLRKIEPHAAVTEGQPVISILARERQALERANARQGRTVEFYDTTRRLFGNSSKP